jgi:hypothetical protein
MPDIISPDRAAGLCRFWDLTSDPIDQFRHWQAASRFTPMTPRHRLQRLAREAEKIVSGRIEALGYQVNPTPHKCTFDLWVTGRQGHAVRVEVKISLYGRNGRNIPGGRYQASLHNEADLLIWIARNGQDWTYIIPMAVVGTRRNIAIPSACPGDYTGQWAAYLEAWEYLHRAVEIARPTTRQLSLL